MCLDLLNISEYLNRQIQLGECFQVIDLLSSEEESSLYNNNKKNNYNNNNSNNNNNNNNDNNKNRFGYTKLQVLTERYIRLKGEHAQIVHYYMLTARGKNGDKQLVQVCGNWQVANHHGHHWQGLVSLSFV